jgi:hypothetical protein
MTTCNSWLARAQHWACRALAWALVCAMYCLTAWSISSCSSRLRPWASALSMRALAALGKHKVPQDPQGGGRGEQQGDTRQRARPCCLVTYTCIVLVHMCAQSRPAEAGGNGALWG